MGCGGGGNGTGGIPLEEFDRIRKFKTETPLNIAQQGNMIDTFMKTIRSDIGHAVVTHDGYILSGVDHHYSYETLRQVAAQTGGKFFTTKPDPNFPSSKGGFLLEDFVWALETLNKTKDARNLGIIVPEEEFEAWKQCFGLVGRIGTTKGKGFFVGEALDSEGIRDYEEVYVKIAPAASCLRDSMKIQGYRVFTKKLIDKDIRGINGGCLREAVEEFLSEEQKAGKADPNIECTIDWDEVEEGLYVTFAWRNYGKKDTKSIDSDESLPKIFAMGIPAQIERLGIAVSECFANYDEGENLIEKYKKGIKTYAECLDDITRNTLLVQPEGGK